MNDGSHLGHASGYSIEVLTKKEQKKSFLCFKTFLFLVKGKFVQNEWIGAKVSHFFSDQNERERQIRSFWSLKKWDTLPESSHFGKGEICPK